MSQQNVYKLLQKTGKWMTTKEIRDKLKCNSTMDNLRKLYKFGEILRKEDATKGIGRRFLWRIK